MSSVETDSEALRSAILSTVEYFQSDEFIDTFLQISSDVLVLGSMRIPLHSYRRVGFFLVGKVAVILAKFIAKRMKESAEIWCLAPLGTKTVLYESSPVRFLFGNHPVPGKESYESSLQLKEVICSFDQRDLLVFLFSGGSSALLTVPVPPLTRDMYSSLNDRLLRSGLTIHKMNVFRRLLDEPKGGGLILWSLARVIAGYISDVVGDNLELIASGPTIGLTLAESETSIESFPEFNTLDKKLAECL
ncbi:MAG TPA: DUF4147 domain-containing protein, partial [Candidatus Hodarchaeales archaeon]|nr:DUF4147 domain-containing protein [Candidatus Hodarchaeales archaeon]